MEKGWWMMIELWNAESKSIPNFKTNGFCTIVKCRKGRKTRVKQELQQNKTQQPVI
jgi:hypothetical protein